MKLQKTEGRRLCRGCEEYIKKNIYALYIDSFKQMGSVRECWVCLECMDKIGFEITKHKLINKLEE